jgi:hypothetical protein
MAESFLIQKVQGEQTFSNFSYVVTNEMSVFPTNVGGFAFNARDENFLYNYVGDRYVVKRHISNGVQVANFDLGQTGNIFISNDTIYQLNTNFYSSGSAGRINVTINSYHLDNGVKKTNNVTIRSQESVSSTFGQVPTPPNPGSVDLVNIIAHPTQDIIYLMGRIRKLSFDGESFYSQYGPLFVCLGKTNLSSQAFFLNPGSNYSSFSSYNMAFQTSTNNISIAGNVSSGLLVNFTHTFNARVGGGTSTNTNHGFNISQNFLSDGVNIFTVNPVNNRIARSDFGGTLTYASSNFNLNNVKLIGFSNDDLFVYVKGQTLTANTPIIKKIYKSNFTENTSSIRPFNVQSNRINLVAGRLLEYTNVFYLNNGLSSTGSIQRVENFTNYVAFNGVNYYKKF